MEDAARARDDVQRLLAKELSVGDAVQIALLNNPGLQAAYAELGIAEADLVQAGRIGNPRFAYLHTSQGGERKLEWALTFPILELITIPLRTKIEDRRFALAKVDAGRRVLEIAAETRRTWYQAVAAQAVQAMALHPDERPGDASTFREALRGAPSAAPATLTPEQTWHVLLARLTPLDRAIGLAFAAALVLGVLASLS